MKNSKGCAIHLLKTSKNLLYFSCEMGIRENCL